MQSTTSQRIRLQLLTGMFCAFGLAHAAETSPPAQAAQTKAPVQAAHRLPKKTPAQIKAELRAVLLRINELSYYIDSANDASADARGAITLSTFECNGPVLPNTHKPWPPKAGDAVDTESLARVMTALKIINANFANGSEPSIQSLCHPL